MEPQSIVAKVQDLSDIELALLLCLIANQHCIIHATEESLEALEEELQLITTNLFGLSAAVVQCSDQTTLDDFSNGILIPGLLEDPSVVKSTKLNRRTSSYRHERPLPKDDRKLANVVIARNLNLSSHKVQIQTLELLRTGRIFTHTDVHTAPKPFLIVALASVSGPPFVKHLNDHIFLSHYHDPEDGFNNLEEASEWIEDDRASFSSVVHRSIGKGPHQEPVFGVEQIQVLNKLTESVTISIDVKRYLYDVLVFLRRHRAVACGVTPLATKHFELLARSLAPLHDIDFVTPSLVQLAARKVYRHRIKLVTADDERSMQYGSELAAVEALLDGLTADDVIYEVLNSIEVPL